MAARIIAGISGAVGAVYAIRLLKVPRELGAQPQLLVSNSGWLTMAQETGLGKKRLIALAESVRKR